MCVCDFFGHSVYKCAIIERIPLQNFYANITQAASKQARAESTNFVCCTFDIFVCSASGKSHCPNAYIYTTLHSAAQLGCCFYCFYYYTLILDSSEAILDIYLHMHDVHTLFVVQPSMKYTHTHSRKNPQCRMIIAREKLLADLLKSGFIYFVVFIPSSFAPFHPPTLLVFAFFFYLI